METQRIFKRYELKYLVTDEQRARLLEVMSEYMAPDEFGRSTISNIYYDTPTRVLVRRSLEKPLYKEKLRLRSYGVASDLSKSYVELKKKYDGVVYKRRVEMSYAEAESFLAGRGCARSGQIFSELDYFLHSYEQLMPAAAIFYDRVAYYGKNDRELRITFDDSILWRDYDLDLRIPASGEELLRPGQSMMEIKVGGGMPLWLARELNALGLYKTSFSKYGSAYTARLSENAGKNERSIFCA